MNIPAQELINYITNVNRCNDCCYFKGETECAIYKEAYMCELTRTIMPNTYACPLYNKDISEEKICYNCKHFLGGGDWGLSCGADYYTLTHALDEGCEKFVDKI